MSATASCHQTRNINDDWTSAKFLGKTEVGRIDTYAEQTMELQVGQRRKCKSRIDSSGGESRRSLLNRLSAVELLHCMEQ